jgi:hypothetical protein
MTRIRSFDRELEAFLAAEAPMTAPAGLHDVVIERAGRTRPRPAWLVSLRGDTFGGSAGILARPRTRVTVLVLLGLLLLALMAALVVGALQSDDTTPLGGNGPIVYTFQGTSHRPGGPHRVGADGGGDSPLPEGTGCPVFSTDGTVMVANSDAGLVVAGTASGVRTIVPVPGLDSWWHPHIGSYAVSPDGSWIAWLKALGPTEDPQPTELWVTKVADGVATRLAAAPSDPAIRLGLPAWSPDGRSIAVARYISGESGHRTTIDVLDVATGATRRLTTRPATNEPGISWSPDGRWITYAGIPDAGRLPTLAGPDEAPERVPHDVFVIAADGTNERNVTETPAFEDVPTWSPDGERLAYLSSPDDDQYRLTTLAMEGGTPAGSPVTGPAFGYVVWSPDGTRLLWADAVHTPATGRQQMTNITTLRSIDHDFAGPSTTLAAFDGIFTCAPAWQRIEP